MPGKHKELEGLVGEYIDINRDPEKPVSWRTHAHGFANLNARAKQSGVALRCASWRAAKQGFLQPPFGRGGSVTATGLDSGFAAVPQTNVRLV